MPASALPAEWSPPSGLTLSLTFREAAGHRPLTRARTTARTLAPTLPPTRHFCAYAGHRRSWHEDERVVDFGRVAVVHRSRSAAQSTEPYRGAWTVTIENDRATGSDNNYTNGLGLAWVSGAVDAGNDGFVGRWTRMWSFLPFVADEGYRSYASWSLAQEINTPDEIRRTRAWTTSPTRESCTSTASSTRKQDWTHAWQLRLGVVGPASQADDTQREFHRVIGADKPRGWHTQLPNEPIVNVSYTVAHLAAAGHAGRSAQWRVVPVATAGLGNYFTGAGLGVYGEVGWNLVDALGITALRSGLNTASTVGVGPQDRWSVSLSGGVGGYGVAHYLPLDGTMFRNSRSVDTKPLIGMATFGITVRNRGFVFFFGRTYFSESFDTERQKPEFGTLSLSWYF